MALESVSDDIHLDVDHCTNLIKEADKNKDGEIDFEEFISIFAADESERTGGTLSESVQLPSFQN